MTEGKSGAPFTGKRHNASAGRQTGHLFIISAPSGAGKTTLCQSVRQQFKQLAYSVSYTTRPPRDGEQDGRDYFFITAEEFKRGITQGQWAEWAEVHENFYGTSAQWIERTLKAGGNILMDIDLQGTRQMVQRFPQAVTIFIMPPSLEALASRLRSRGTDTPETINVRLKNAKDEIAQRDICRHVLVNDDLEETILQLNALISGYLGGDAKKNSPSTG